MASENELIVQLESLKLERARLEQEAAISEDLEGVSIGPEGLVCTNGRALRRMSVFYSGSTIWPEQFQGKPQNCFVALTLAAVLRCDPTMLACNLYEYKGRWGMQSKLTTALAARAGVFRGVIWHTFDGEGDDYTCTAHAIMASDGREVELPLSRRKAKGLGWYEPKGEKKLPSKWMQMEDEMMMYRTSDWLIRHYCPQVTMGLLSADEVEEIGEREPARPQKSAPKKHALPAPVAAPKETAEKVDPMETRLKNLMSLIDQCQTKEAIKSLHQSIGPKGFAELGIERGTKIRERCIAREKELSNGETATDSRGQEKPPEAGKNPSTIPAKDEATPPGHDGNEPVKRGRGRPRKATDAEIEAEQKAFDEKLRKQAAEEERLAALPPDQETPEDSQTVPVEEDYAPSASPIADANEYLPEQWSNSQVDQCVALIHKNFPTMTDAEKSAVDELGAARKKRLATNS